jgi:uncharacterized protein (DUF885 family)
MSSAAKRIAPVLCLFVICVAVCAAQATLSLEARRKVLSDFFTEYWDYQMRTNPLEASARGDKRWNDKLADFSQEFLDKDLLQNKIFLDRLEAIDTSGFPDQEVVSKRILVHDLKTTLEGARFKSWEMAVTQESGPQIEVPGLFTLLSFESVKDYEDYISRLKALPLLFDQTVIQLRKGIADQLMPPRFILEKVVDQCTNITSKAPDDSAFATPFKNFPKSISDADKTRLTNDGLAAIRNGVLPAYAHFAQFVSQDYAPHGRVEPGVWSLPNGDAYYAFRVKESTTTDLTPDEIHQLGLAQVKEIEGEMNAVATKLGYADFKSFNAALATDPKVHGQSRQQILDLYKHYVDQMYPKLPELFYRLPKAKLVVLPVEEFKEKDAASASYVLPAEDGSRPGRVMVNTGDFAKRSTLDAESTAYHEGVPGHHMQVALAMETTDLPEFRRNAFYTAYIEGWGLYAERLGKEVGFYQDPYMYYGHLEDEMLRAIRLVVDTGLHSKHWTRQQVVDYFHAHSVEDEVSVQSETNRYIAWPGQALGYKVGQLTILELRQYAKDQLGDKYDIRAFNDEVLSGGAVPMDVLKERIHEWVATQNKSPAN